MGSSGSMRGNSGGRKGSGGRGGGRGSAQFDPLACYRCGVRGHLARHCPNSGTQSQTLGSSSFGTTRGSSFKSGRSGPKRGRGRHVRFGRLNVLYNSEGCEYPVDDYGQVYVPFKFEQTGASVKNEEKKEETIKN